MVPDDADRISRGLENVREAFGGACDASSTNASDPVYTFPIGLDESGIVYQSYTRSKFNNFVDLAILTRRLRNAGCTAAPRPQD